MHRAGLTHTIQHCTYWATRCIWSGTSCTSDIDSVKHAIQQIGFASGASRVEGFLQSVSCEVASIDRNRIEQLDASRSDIPNVKRHVAAHVARQSQREILDVGSDVIGIVEKTRPTRCRLTKFDRHRLHGLLVVRNWEAADASATARFAQVRQ